MAKRIEDIDVNFKTASLNGVELAFANALASPFALSGFPWRGGKGELLRLPEKTLPLVNEGARSLSRHTSGGIVRFRTDSPSIGLRSVRFDSADMSHMTRLGASGFDLYLGSGLAKRYFRSAIPAQGDPKLESLLASGLPQGELREWTVYLPLYSGVETLEIGVLPGSKLEPPPPFSVAKPIVFYGSSITQGGCASRPGNCYSSLLSRWLDAPIVNLGFSGSGRGEKAVAEAIAGLEMSAFVLDYDHNAPNPEHLEATHEIFFQTVRERNPKLPVLILSKCDFSPVADTLRRREIIKGTWRRAVERGDKLVYFIDGESLFGSKDRDSCTVDGCHPNDLGFYRFAERLLPVLRGIFDRKVED